VLTGASRRRDLSTKSWTGHQVKNYFIFFDVVIVVEIDGQIRGGRATASFSLHRLRPQYAFLGRLCVGRRRPTAHRDRHPGDGPDEAGEALQAQVDRGHQCLHGVHRPPQVLKAVRNRATAMVRRDKEASNLAKLVDSGNSLAVLWEIANAAVGKPCQPLPTSLT
jgi:hypothetical protein